MKIKKVVKACLRLSVNVAIDSAQFQSDLMYAMNYPKVHAEMMYWMMQTVGTAPFTRQALVDLMLTQDETDELYNVIRSSLFALIEEPSVEHLKKIESDIRATLSQKGAEALNRVFMHGSLEVYGNTQH